MNLQEFELLFGGSIKAWISWDRLRSAKASVREQILTDQSGLGSLLTVWYTNASGGHGDWRDPGAIVQSVAESALNPLSWPGDRQARVEYFRSQLVGLAEPAVFILPAYKVPAGNLLLDSTHRMVAAYLAAVDVRVLVLTIEGPLWSDVLPDLTHHKETRH